MSAGGTFNLSDCRWWFSFSTHYLNEAILFRLHVCGALRNRDSIILTDIRCAANYTRKVEKHVSKSAALLCYQEMQKASLRIVNCLST